MKELINFNIKHKNIILRADLNVPVVDGKITDKSRIKIIIPTINNLKLNKNKIFIVSHYGRPKGKKDDKYSLKFLSSILQKELLIDKIFFLESLEDKKINKTINKMLPGDICIVENIRFYPQEEKNDLNFAKKIAKNFDAYVNDAFSASHRNHASITGIPKFIPSFAGLSLVREIKNIDYFFKQPSKPNLAIIGGSKVSTKIDLLYNLSKSFDSIVIGGAMANTFLFANGIDIGISLCEKNLSDLALKIMQEAKKNKCKIILPIDVVCSNNLDDKINIRKCNVSKIEPNQMALDVGQKTINLISEYILKSKMILWNGPLGAFEYKPFNKSSISIANIIKKNSKLLNIPSIAGGGDTVSAINSVNAEDGFTYISNAGGAFLEWLEGNQSPGIIALENN